jgi:hypothetical protein
VGKVTIPFVDAKVPWAWVITTPMFFIRVLEFVIHSRATTKNRGRHSKHKETVDEAFEDGGIPLGRAKAVRECWTEQESVTDMNRKNSRRGRRWNE